jgi:hypothetical protein
VGKILTHCPDLESLHIHHFPRVVRHGWMNVYDLLPDTRAHANKLSKLQELCIRLSDDTKIEPDRPALARRREGLNASLNFLVRTLVYTIAHLKGGEIPLVELYVPSGVRTNGWTSTGGWTDKATKAIIQMFEATWISLKKNPNASVP